MNIVGDKVFIEVIKVGWDDEEWALIQYDWCLNENGKFRHIEIHTEGEDGQGESHGIHSPSRLVDESSVANTLIWVFKSPELCDSKFLLLKSPSWWYLVKVVLVNKCSNPAQGFEPELHKRESTQLKVRDEQGHSEDDLVWVLEPKLCQKDV